MKDFINDENNSFGEPQKNDENLDKTYEVQKDTSGARDDMNAFVSGEKTEIQNNELNKEDTPVVENSYVYQSESYDGAVDKSSDKSYAGSSDEAPDKGTSDSLIDNKVEYNTDTTPPYYNNMTRTPRPSEEKPQAYNPTQYNIPQMNGNGQISYAPVSPNKAKNKKKKGGGKAAGIAVLCACGLLLSCGAGFFGASLANYYDDGGYEYEHSGSPSSGGPTIYKTGSEVPVSSEGSASSYADIINSISETVVEIYTEYTTYGYFQYVSEGAGSGVIISEDGYIITNNHVICGTNNTTVADSIKVRMKNGDEYEAKVIGTDSGADIAVIKIDKDELPCAVFGDSDNLAVGEEVIAIGNPLGQLGGTATNGIISALAREVVVEKTTMNLLQTNAAINSGNSGGGLFNMKGELVGIVNAKSSGTGIEGLGFAIPSNDALEISKQLMEFGYVKGKPMIGVTVSDVTDASTARRLGVNAYGVYITKLVEGYNDDVLEIKDRILAVNGTEITSGDDVIQIVKSSSIGDVIELTLYRDGKLMTVEVTCYDSGEVSASESGE